MSKNAFSLRTRALAAYLVLLFLAPAARAVTLSGYREGAGNTPQECYQYVTFGRYPYERDGSQAPVLWRVLGPGTPEKADVIDAVNEPPRSWKKTGNGDDLSGDNADLVCLMTEYIVDTLLYNGEKDTADGTPLDYENTAVYRTLNTQVLATLFTSEEKAVLCEMPDRGLLALPTRRGELFRTDYGFPPEDFTESRTRRATGTPWAFAGGLKRINGPYSWYFTADWRRPGFRWIVGDNGHISVSGADRVGGVRFVCYVHAALLKSEGGAGTFDDPIRLSPLPAAGE